MIYQQWSYSIPTSYSLNHLSIKSIFVPFSHTLLQPILPFLSNSLFAFFFLSYSQPHVFSSICCNSKSRPLCPYDAISLLKTNLLCNPPLGSPVEVKKTFLSHSPKPFINFYYSPYIYHFFMFTYS